MKKNLHEIVLIISPNEKNSKISTSNLVFKLLLQVKNKKLGDFKSSPKIRQTVGRIFS